MKIENLILEATSLNKALIGIETFMWCSFSNTEQVTLEDINVLNGLIIAVKTLSERHEENMINLSEVSE